MRLENGEEILLVEDNPRDAELTMRSLRKRNLGNKIKWVTDGTAALDYLFGNSTGSGSNLLHQPRVILLDLKLPKMDGLEVLSHLKSNNASRTIPVVVLTSSREEQDIIRSYSLGVNSYIVKPVSFDNFSEAVAQLGMYWLLLNQPPQQSVGTEQ